jgi:dipeptidase
MAANSSPYYNTYYNSTYPFSVKPENLISPFDLMAIHRDWYG